MAAAASVHECSKCIDTGLSTIQCLKTNSFSSRSFAEKSEIVTDGRPMPHLDLTTESKGKRAYNRHFNPGFYETHTWLAGCEVSQKLFCWPCLLFSSFPSNWNNKGFSDLNNLVGGVKKHEDSKAHLTALLQLHLFGKTRIETQIDKQTAADIKKQHEKVDKNRKIFQRLIDAVVHLAKQGLAFRAHDESAESDNRGNYIKLVDLMSQYDSLLKEHLDGATVFTGLGSHIQNDIIECTAETVVDFIKQAVEKAKFVAVIVDEATDIRFRCQLSIILRYISELTGEPEESFLGYVDVTNDRTADAMCEIVLNKLKEFNCTEKLVAQTYDGAAVNSGELRGLQAQIKRQIPYATFVHCYAHRLNLVLAQSSSEISQCRVFFSSLTGLPEFFSSSTKRVALLDKIVHARLPGAAKTRFNSQSKLANAVKNHYDDLLKVFNEITKNPRNWDGDSIAKARGFERMLEDFEFCFLLNLFSEIFSLTSVLFEMLQSKSQNIKSCIEKIDKTKEHLSEMLTDEGFNKFFEETVEMIGNPHPKRNVSAEETKHNLYLLYLSVVENICEHLKARFEHVKELKFLELFNFDKFDKYRTTFPQDSFDALLSVYGKLFNSSDRLKNELKMLYSSNEFSSITSVSQLFSFLRAEKLDVMFTELATLTTLVLTIPATSSSAERSFSALKRIKTYLRSTMGQARLSALAILSIEKRVVSILMKTKSNFYERVIKKFCRNKDRRFNLQYD